MLPFGFGLEVKSKNAYVNEWNLYLRFCQRRGIKRIPGREVQWKLKVVKPFLEWRAQRVNVRTLHSVRSKLKHCGLCYGYLLPNAKGEGPAALRLQLAMVMRNIAKRQKQYCKEKGISADPKRALALGRVAIGLLFSAYGATTRAGFDALTRPIRNWLVICVCMHTGCMRFKLLKTLCRNKVIRWAAADRTYRMASDWRKMKRGGAFTVPFPLCPEFKAMKYHGYSKHGQQVNTFTAGLVLQWHIANRGTSSGNLFAPFGAASKPSRRALQVWLRQSFGHLLIGDVKEIASLIAAISPHSFRAGMAGDLERERIPRLHIKKVGRWTSDSAMEQYARDGLAQRIQKLIFKKIAKTDQSKIHKLATAAHPRQAADSSEEEFGSSAEEPSSTR